MTHRMIGDIEIAEVARLQIDPETQAEQAELLRDLARNLKPPCKWHRQAIELNAENDRLHSRVKQLEAEKYRLQGEVARLESMVEAKKGRR